MLKLELTKYKAPRDMKKHAVYARRYHKEIRERLANIEQQMVTINEQLAQLLRLWAEW